MVYHLPLTPAGDALARLLVKSLTSQGYATIETKVNITPQTRIRRIETRGKRNGEGQIAASMKG